MNDVVRTSDAKLTEHPRVIGLFRIVRKMADGLYVIETGEKAEPAMWTLRKLRKTTHCSATRKTLNKGELHYGPIGNMDYRSWRIHRQFVEERRLEKAHGNETREPHMTELE